MKQLLFIVFYFVAVGVSIQAYEIDSTLVTNVWIMSLEENPEVDKSPIKKRRVPGYSLPCVISMTEGIAVQGVDKNEFISFSLEDENGVVTWFTDEADFVNALISSNSPAYFRIYTDSCTYGGTL